MTAPTDADARVDGNGLTVLDRETCLQLLEREPVGRVGTCMHALPVVLPVNFVIASPPWDEDEPVAVIRTVEGTKLNAALDSSVIALEVDGYDPLRHSGWSVLVQGIARPLDGPAERAWAASLPLRPWAMPGADRSMAVSLDIISGRRFDSPAERNELRWT